MRIQRPTKASLLIIAGVIGVVFLAQSLGARKIKKKPIVDIDDWSLAAKASFIRPSERESKFKEIPWVFDLFAAFRLAKEEERPVFLYTVGGDPLGDC